MDTSLAKRLHVHTSPPMFRSIDHFHVPLMALSLLLLSGTLPLGTPTCAPFETLGHWRRSSPMICSLSPYLEACGCMRSINVPLHLLYAACLPPLQRYPVEMLKRPSVASSIYKAVRSDSEAFVRRSSPCHQQVFIL